MTCFNLIMVMVIREFTDRVVLNSRKFFYVAHGLVVVVEQRIGTFSDYDASRDLELRVGCIIIWKMSRMSKLVLCPRTRPLLSPLG